MGSNPTVGVWYRGVMESQQIANLPYKNVVRVRVTAIPLATTQMTGTSAARSAVKGCCKIQKCRVRSTHHLRSRNNGIPAEISGIIYPHPGVNTFCSCFHYLCWWVLRKHIEFFWRRSTSGYFAYLPSAEKVS